MFLNLLREQTIQVNILDMVPKISNANEYVANIFLKTIAAVIFFFFMVQTTNKFLNILVYKIKYTFIGQIFFLFSYTTVTSFKISSWDKT